MNIPQSNLKRIVVVGGGFGGLKLAKKLRKSPFQVVLIDKNNYHTFQPLLYQVATAGLEPDSIAYPIRNIFKKQKNFFFRIAEVEKINEEKNIIETSIGELSYDYLVVATGSDTNFFGMKPIEEQSMTMKSVIEALNLRSLILQSFEQALITKDLAERERLMNFVIVGGGPTGVELAGALAELRNHVLPNDYPDLDFRQMNIHLIQSGDKLLVGMSEESSKKSYDFLIKLGVKVWLNTRVTDYDGDYAKTNVDKDIPAETLIWAAGVKGNIVNGINAVQYGRIDVDEYNRVKGTENIFAIGDVALMITERSPKGHPMVAPVAVQQGQHLAKNFQLIGKGKELKPFKYKDKGSMATVGRNLAVVDLPKLKFQGMFAWYIWMFVHLISLVGFRNRMIVFVNWMWSYFKFDKGVRLIVRPFNRERMNLE